MASAVFDTIPPDPATDLERLRSTSASGAAFVAFQGNRLELLTEAFSITHRDTTTGIEWTSRGGYAQAAWSFGRWKPYYRFDRLDRDESDPYYPVTLEDIDKHTVGLRVDPWSRVALKLELGRARIAGGSPFTAAAVQAAFTF